jgi:hypothetical protein
VAVASGVLAAGCGADDPAVEASPRLTADDVRPIVTVAPDATGWRWTAKPETRVAPAVDVERWEPAHAVQETYRDAQLAAGLVRTAASSWWDDGKKASSFADLYATAEGARSALEAGKTFADGWFSTVERRQFEELDLDGPGEARWAVRGETDASGFVEIGWVRGNAVLGVYVDCSPCASDVVAAAQQWADAMDEAAVKPARAGG